MFLDKVRFTLGWVFFCFYDGVMREETPFEVLELRLQAQSIDSWHEVAL